jgi:hypothetical protein
VSNSEHISKLRAHLSNYVALTARSEHSLNNVWHGNHLARPIFFRSSQDNRLDIIGATTSSRMPHWSSQDVKATLNRFRTPSGQREWGFDVFYCPIDLFEYIADITVLYKLQPDPRNIGQDAIQKSILLGNAVKSWETLTDEPSPRSHMVEVWRQGILLYVIRLFRLPSDIFNTRNLTGSIFRHARAIPPRTSWSYSISWPLFHAGLLLPREDDETKIWLRDEQLTNFRAIGCFSQKLAVETLEQIWRTGPDRLDDLFASGSQQRGLLL